MAEKTIKSIRANQAVFDRLSAVAKEGGLDQGAALEALLNAWDVQAAKGQVPERAADVADFDAHVQGIQSAFLRSLELAQSAEARARVSYQAQLDAMTATISRLQADLEASGKRRAELFQSNQELQARLDAAEARVAELEKGRKLESLLEALSDRLDAPVLPEAKPKRGRKAKAVETEAASEEPAEAATD